ncbi:hypothetical protein Sta7437_2130 [Stanieria cyanosphaera PCC 7437]|uniref:Uncharacterized protein n=1 Tax=Stanieria cyanosphaera (strain ATCC 29371 / PCC 7437) TaxID=111780 RepID=K9XSU6_STAC7|nr:DUF6208 family protein [Stanieria cyanosphaera]AFZ35680.1 hypothetical protein Sta7437_2130 [Stanieria cyanosphaera PCC 7437]
MNNIVLIGEITLALLSFIFYKIMKFLIGNLFTLYLATNKKKASQWRVLSQETINSFLSLPVLMTKGPRWNTHAIIGTLGPFAVQKSISIDLQSANNSAGSWIAVVYSFPTYRTITSLESHQINSTKSWQSIELKPGKYSLGLRYYNWRNSINLPAIKIDNQDFVSATDVPNNINDFYHNLIQAKNWFYLSLHYYIFTILKLRKWLPESFVRYEFLPVGAPATEFFYNYLTKTQTLQLEFSNSLIQDYDIYFTIYDRSSLPLNYCQIKTEKYTLPATGMNGYYLLRIRPKPNTTLEQVSFNSQLIEENNQLQHWLLQ